MLPYLVDGFEVNLRAGMIVDCLDVSQEEAAALHVQNLPDLRQLRQAAPHGEPATVSSSDMNPCLEELHKFAKSGSSTA